MNRHGFVRITSASARTAIGDPEANADEILRVLECVPDSDIALFAELALSGYTCADLFGQAVLLDGVERAAARLIAATAGRPQLVVVGAPVRVENNLYNAALVVADGQALGIVPKQFLPNYKEFYEQRWFRGATGDEPPEVAFAGQTVPFGIDLLFEAGEGVVVGVEVCEDLWMPVPPSSLQAIAGATILLNLSASNELIGKSDYRYQLVVGQSGRCIAAYAYSSCGPSESTTDLVFGGHCLIAENGRLLAESSRVGDGGPIPMDSHLVTQDVDVQKLRSDRRVTTSFGGDTRHRRPYRRIAFPLARDMEGLQRVVDGRPFVPREGAELHRRCAEIFGIQCAGLARRVMQLGPESPLNIGVSGGLDSTLALLVAVKTCDRMGWSRRRIHGLTMPGFGTTARTRTNAVALMEHLGITAERIDIGELALRTFQDLDHRPLGIDCRGMTLAEFEQALAHVPPERRHDLVFENVQARLRTLLLMSRGFVVGTGDLSEQALGWSTYNADHMSMYNPNTSIPKTLVKFLVEYVARNEFEAGPARETLLSIVETTISPELLPATAAGEIEQSTEATLGPYELHDFILFQAVRCGFAPEKIRFLADFAAFSTRYTPEQIDRALRTFFERFFRNQFKRSCVPDGPKVGSVSLSPRGDWRMPSDADPAAWLRWADQDGPDLEP
jgi:NAD+ synthase (glutamine-hydrolysing)